MTTKIIAFSGTQNTGKTTMRKVMADILTNIGYKVTTMYVANVREFRYGGDPKFEEFTSPERLADKLGFKLNEGTTFETQYFLAHLNIEYDLRTRKAAQHYHNIEGMMADYIIYDRTVLDVIPYTMRSRQISYEQKKLIYDTLVQHWNRFPADFVYAPETVQMEDDKVRSTDPAFQEEIQAQFKQMWENLKVPIRKLPKFSDDKNESIAARVRQVLSEVTGCATQ